MLHVHGVNLYNWVMYVRLHLIGSTCLRMNANETTNSTAGPFPKITHFSGNRVSDTGGGKCPAFGEYEGRTPC